MIFRWTEVQVPLGASILGHHRVASLFGGLQYGTSYWDPADLSRLAQPGRVPTLSWVDIINGHAGQEPIFWRYLP